MKAQRSTRSMSLTIARSLFCGFAACVLFACASSSPSSEPVAEPAQAASTKAAQKKPAGPPTIKSLQALLDEQVVPVEPPDFDAGSYVQLKPQGHQAATLWEEVYRIGKWFRTASDDDEGDEWIATEGEGTDTLTLVTRSLLSNLLVLPLLVLGLFGALLTLQKIHRLSTTVDEAKADVTAVRKQMGQPERR